MKRRNRTSELRRLTREGKRCESRHPNWHGVRCEKEASPHIDHEGDGASLTWTIPWRLS